MLYVGMDVHKEFIQIAAVDDDDAVLLNERVAADRDSVVGFLSRFPKEARYVMESSSVWYWLYRLMTDELGLDVTLSNPYLTKAIAASKRKTDKIDALVLARLLRGGYIARCHVPDERVVGLRQLVRHRMALVEGRARYKILVRGILLQRGTAIPGSPFTPSYREALRRIDDYRIDGYLEMISSHDRLIVRADERVSSEAAALPAAAILMTIPGVGAFLALAIAAEIGDVSGFRGSSAVVSYADLAPSVRNSADAIRHGKITRRGSSVLRHAAMQAARLHATYVPDGAIAAFRGRLLRRRKERSKAAVASAAKLLRIMYWMLREGREYGQDRSQGRTRGRDVGNCPPRG